jgi:hypothetical protein
MFLCLIYSNKLLGWPQIGPGCEKLDPVVGHGIFLSAAYGAQRHEFGTAVHRWKVGKYRRLWHTMQVPGHRKRRGSTTFSIQPSGGKARNWSPLHTRQWADNKFIREAQRRSHRLPGLMDGRNRCPIVAQTQPGRLSNTARSNAMLVPYHGPVAHSGVRR